MDGEEQENTIGTVIYKPGIYKVSLNGGMVHIPFKCLIHPIDCRVGNIHCLDADGALELNKFYGMWTTPDGGFGDFAGGSLIIAGNKKYGTIEIKPISENEEPMYGIMLFYLSKKYLEHGVTVGRINIYDDKYIGINFAGTFYFIGCISKYEKYNSKKSLLTKKVLRAYYENPQDFNLFLMPINKMNATLLKRFTIEDIKNW